LYRARETLPDLPLFLGGFDEKALAQAERIVISPGVAQSEPAIAAAIAKGVPVIGEIELFAQFATAPVVGITGSNGKSTVTTLVGNMTREAGLNVAVGGNLGTPALDLINDPEPQAYVLELSSFQLETVSSLSVHAGVVLNVSEDHMDRYDDMACYLEAKLKLFNGSGIIVNNLDEPLLRDRISAFPKERGIIAYSLQDQQGCDLTLREKEGKTWIFGFGEWILPVSEVRVPGRHNLSNILAALALADTLGVPTEAAAEAIRKFRGLPHRTQWITEQKGVTWYNDSKGTNVGATIAAVNGLHGPVVLIAGGDGKGADFSPLAKALQGKVKAVILIGRDGPVIAEAIGEAVPVEMATTLEDAVKKAAAVAVSGDNVILSPACASFDMFDNYVQRGKLFTQAVMEMAR
jgi:UDP-N-acetylmuramoylalanine--D-glutamate ligase